MVNIYIAADHGGLELKENLKKYLTKKGLPIKDLGAKQKKPLDDYPDYAKKLAKKIQQEKNAFGILICGSGVGMVIAANKYKGIRAAHAHDSNIARAARQHNNANVLCMGNWYVSKKKAEQIVDKFLFTAFITQEKYKRRQKKVDKIIK